MRRFWLVAAAVLGLQFALLLSYSAFLYHRFDLTDDFGTYSQAWWLIGHGHLNPVDTIQAPPYPFWKSHAEFAMWPLALIGRVWPDPVLLLWLQDAAVVATEWMAMTWVAAVCATRVPRYRCTIALASLAFLVVNPWWYLTASFDVHFEVIGLPFVVWAGYALWRGRSSTALIVGSVALLFGDVVAVSVVAVGIAGMLSGRVRHRFGWRTSALLTGVAASWLVAIALAGANRGSAIVANYGYLVGARPTASSTWVLKQLALHPWHAARLIADRWAAMLRVLGSAGLVGVLTPWGFVLSFGILVPAAANVNRVFLSPTIAFQTLGAIPFVFVGTVLILVRLGTGRGRKGHHAPGVRGRPAVAVVLAAALATVALVQNVPLYGTIVSDWWKVDAPTAAVLRRTLPLVPADAEVIASQGVIGRFAGRTEVYPFLVSPQQFPIRAAEVVFVIVPTQGNESVPPTAAEIAIKSLEGLPGVHVLARSNSVSVLAWHPPKGVSTIVLPGPSPAEPPLRPNGRPSVGPSRS